MRRIHQSVKGAGSGPSPWWIAVAAVALLIVGFGAAAPAFGATNPVFAGPPIDFFGGTKILGGMTTQPNGTTISLTPPEALAFMQSWLPDSVAGHPTTQRPPASVKRGTVIVGVLDVDGKTKIAAKVFYATQGATVWVGMPAQPLWAGAAVTKETWQVASFPAKLLAGAEGKLAPDLPASTTVAPTTTVAPARASHSSSSSNAWIGIVAVVLVAVLLAIGWALRSRRGGGDKPV